MGRVARSLIHQTDDLCGSNAAARVWRACPARLPHRAGEVRYRSRRAILAPTPRPSASRAICMVTTADSADGPTPLVGVIMGSRSDLRVMTHAAALLAELGVGHEVRIVSAHRTPDWMYEYARAAEGRGLEVIIAAAGGAAHLPGMVAALTLLPVLGVPIPATALNGVDALLSIVQMPKGVPVGTLAIGKPGAANAALLAAEICALTRPELRERLRAYRERARQDVLAQTVE